MKQNYLLKFLLISIISLNVGCKKPIAADATGTTNGDDISLNNAKNGVIDAGEIFVIAINDGDYVGAANCYTIDAKIMRPNSKPIVGRAEILKAFNQRLEAGKLHFSMKTTAVYGSVNELTAEEEWMLSDNTGKIIDEGKSLEVFKKEDGKWKMFRDCFNSNLPCMHN